MGYNAGSIEATLTLDRDPFQRGLEEAKAEGQRFEQESFKAKLDVSGDQESKQKIDSVETSARKLTSSNPTVKVDADDALVQQKIARLQAKLEELRRQKATPTIDLDIAAAEVQRQKIADQLDALAAKKADPKIDLDIAAAQLKQVELAAKLDELQAKPYTAKAELDEGKLLIQIAQVEQRLQALADKKATLQIDTDEVALNVKLAAIQAKIEKLNGQKATVTVDADIAAAEAQLATLQATTDGAGDAADAAAPKFNLMAAGIAAGFPPASTAVLALTGALELAAIPMVAIKVGMTGIQAAAAPLAGSFLDLQSVVSATFEQGLKPAVQDIAAVMPTVQAGLVGTAGALSLVADRVGRVASSQAALGALQESFSNIESVIIAMTPGITGFTQNVIDLGALGTGSLGGLANIVNGLAVQWHALIQNLTESGTAQVAIQSLVAALAAVAAWIPPLVQAGVQLMAVIGPPLAAALQLVGGALNLLTGPLGAVTTAVAAGVGIFLAAQAAIGVLGTAITAGASAWASFTAFVTGANTETAASAGASATAAAAQGALATSVYGTAAAATEAAATLEAAATAAAANAAALEADAVAARNTAVALAAAAAAGGDLAAAEAAATAATTANAAALEGQAVAARASAAAQGAARASMAATGSAAAAGAATTGGFAAALGTIGTAAIAVGAALAIGYVAVKAFTTSTDEAVAALAKGGAAADAMTTKVKNQTQVSDASASSLQKWGDAVDNWISSEIFGMATIDSVTQAQEAHRASLTGLQRAQEDATKAQGDYQQAVDKFGPTSQQATDAQKKYAEATLAVTQAQAGATLAATNIDAAMQGASAHFGDAAQAADSAAQGAIAWANALATLAAPLASASDKMKAFAADIQGASDAPRTLLEAMNAADKSITSFADSALKITPAMIDATGAINTTTKAGQELATGILGSAKAYDNLYGATLASAQANGDTVPQAFAKAASASEDFRQKLIAQAIQHGATATAAKAMVDQYLAIPKEVQTQITQPGMVTALADTLGLGKSIVSLPSDKSIVVKSLSDDAKAKLEDLGLTVTKLPNGQILVTADASQADAEVERARVAASSKEALIPIGATTAGYDLALRDGVGAALATTGANVPIGGNLTAYSQSLRDGVGAALATTDAYIPLGASTQGFDTAVHDSVGAALMAAPTLPIGGDPSKFNAVVTSSQGLAAASIGVMPLDGAPALFEGKVQQSITLADGSTGVIALDANPTLADGKITTAVTFANGQKGVMTLDANVDPATGRINGTVSYGNGQTSRISVDANAAAANAAIDNAARPRFTTITVQTVMVGANVSGSASAPIGAGGGLVGFAGGGIVPGAIHMAMGGVFPGYAPGVDNIPAILSPGEAVLVPELVRQLGPGNILAANMAASGRQPTFWNGAKPVGGDGVALGSLSVGSGGSPVATVLAAFAARIEKAVADQATTSEVTQKLTARVDDLVSEIRRSGAGASIVVNDRSGDPVETARETTLRLRLRR